MAYGLQVYNAASQLMMDSNLFQMPELFRGSTSSALSINLNTFTNPSVPTADVRGYGYKVIYQWTNNNTPPSIPTSTNSPVYTYSGNTLADSGTSIAPWTVSRTTNTTPGAYLWAIIIRFNNIVSPGLVFNGIGTLTTTVNWTTAPWNTAEVKQLGYNDASGTYVGGDISENALWFIRPSSTASVGTGATNAWFSSPVYSNVLGPSMATFFYDVQLDFICYDAGAGGLTSTSGSTITTTTVNFPKGQGYGLNVFNGSGNCIYSSNSNVPVIRDFLESPAVTFTAPLNNPTLANSAGNYKRVQGTTEWWNQTNTFAYTARDGGLPYISSANLGFMSFWTVGGSPPNGGARLYTRAARWNSYSSTSCVLETAAWQYGFIPRSTGISGEAYPQGVWPRNHIIAV